MVMQAITGGTTLAELHTELQRRRLALQVSPILTGGWHATVCHIGAGAPFGLCGSGFAATIADAIAESLKRYFTMAREHGVSVEPAEYIDLGGEG